MAGGTLPRLAVLLLIFFNLPSHSPAKDDDKPIKGDSLISYVCEDTSEVDLCFSSLSSDPRSSKVYYKDIGVIQVDVVVAQLNDTLSHITSLLHNIHLPILSKCIEKCQKIYDVSIKDLSRSNYVRSKETPEEYDYQPALTAVFNTKGNLTECRNTFKIDKVLHSPIERELSLGLRLAEISCTILGDLLI